MDMKRHNVSNIKKLLGIIEVNYTMDGVKKPILVWFSNNLILDNFKSKLRSLYCKAPFVSDISEELACEPMIICHRYVDQMNLEVLKKCVDFTKQKNTLIIYLANEYEHSNCPAFVDEEFEQIDLTVRNVIILNHMFTGNYLSNNIGHEIINLFSADDGRQYIYLCKDGKFERNDVFVEHVVQVRRPDKTKNTLEIINIASNLSSYNKDSNEPYYGKVPVSEIFKYNNAQQEVCVTFIAGTMRKPLYNIPIRTSKDKTIIQGNCIYLINYSPSQQLREYIYEELDENGRTKVDSNYYRLKNYIEGVNSTNIIDSLPAVDTNCDISTSVAEIYGILGRELSYSDAFCYFIEKYPNLFLEFFNNKGVCLDDEEILSVHREWQNIDLLVKCRKHWFVIENKIFSDLNGVDGNQLLTYRNRVETEISSNNSLQVIYILLHPNHNNIILHKDEENWQCLKYREVYYFLQSKQEQLDDAEFNEFLKSLEPHIYEDFNFSVMRKRFVRAIMKIINNNKEEAENPKKE